MLKEEKKSRENNNDGKKETIDIDKCYRTSRENFETILKKIGETQTTIDNLFKIYSYGCDRLVDLREILWIYLLTGGPSYEYKLDKIFTFVDLNSSNDLDKVEFNKLIYSVMNAIDKAFYIYYACKNFKIMTEYIFKEVSDDKKVVTSEQVKEFFEHKGLLVKFMRNFEDIANEKLSVEKSHMVQIENEKNFYKQLMQQSMKKEFEDDKMRKKIVFDSKRNKTKTYEDDYESEWTVSRPETREFGKENARKKTEAKNIKRVKKFKESSIYENNYLNYNQRSEFNFSQPIYNSKQNDGFKFIDMNLFRYKRVEEKPLDYERYIGYKDQDMGDTLEFGLTLGQDYLREYYMHIINEQEKLNDDYIKELFKDKKYNLNTGDEKAKIIVNRKENIDRKVDTILYPRMHLNSIFDEMNYVDSTKKNLERDLSYNQDIINIDKVIQKKNKKIRQGEDVPLEDSDEEENRWQYIKRDDIENLYKWFLRLCEQNSDFAYVETVRKDFGETKEEWLMKYDSENYYYIWTVKNNYDKYLKDNDKKYISFYDILQILFGNYNKSFDIIWKWVSHIYIMREGKEISWNMEEYLKHYYYYIWHKAHNTYKPELIRKEDPKEMKLTFKQFEEQCKSLIKNLQVEIDWWRDRVSSLSIKEAKNYGQDSKYWDEMKEKSIEEGKIYLDPREGIIDINLFLNILENNKAYEPSYYVNLTKKLSERKEL
eukprot:Mrub_01178.p1 GENE.Mrub_01178~~Mrub_01178.p1  ORF type:complete len:760 (-),score=134.93 Mrub_01178:90-2222(-)